MIKKIHLITLSFLLITGTRLIAQEKYPFEVKVSGKGQTPVILIPGFSCSGEVWNETLEQLEPKYKCYTLTFDGFAGAKADSNPSVKNWIASIGKYIDNEHLVKPVVIGHSIGGVMAEWLAADYPDKISKIVVVDALPCLAALTDSSYKANATPDCTFSTKYFKSIADAQFKQMQTMSARGMVQDTSKVQRIVQWAVQSDRNTLGQIYCQFLNTDLRNKISAIVCPALILLEPEFKDNKEVDAQYKNLKTAKLQYAGKGLHFVMYDDKEWYLKQLDSFL